MKFIGTLLKIFGWLLMLVSLGYFIMALYAGGVLYGGDFTGNHDWSMWLVGSVAGLFVIGLGRQLGRIDRPFNQVSFVMLSVLSILSVSIFIFIAMNYWTFY